MIGAIGYLIINLGGYNGKDPKNYEEVSEKVTSVKDYSIKAQKRSSEKSA